MDSERLTLIAEIAVLFGLYRGLVGKDGPRSAAFRADYKQKLEVRLARAKELNVDDPEVRFIEMRMKYYEFRRS